MQFLIVAASFLAVATAIPASNGISATNIQSAADINNIASAWTKAKEDDGCSWLSCISSVVGQSATCAAAAAELALNPIADVACVAGLGTMTVACKPCV